METPVNNNQQTEVNESANQPTDKPKKGFKMLSNPAKKSMFRMTFFSIFNVILNQVVFKFLRRR